LALLILLKRRIKKIGQKGVIIEGSQLKAIYFGKEAIILKRSFFFFSLGISIYWFKLGGNFLNPN